MPDAALGTGLLHYNARQYDPLLARFAQPDPLTVDGANRYAYVRNNPTGMVDPSGRCSELVFHQYGDFSCTIYADEATRLYFDPVNKVSDCNVQFHCPTSYREAQRQQRPPNFPTWRQWRDVATFGLVTLGFVCIVATVSGCTPIVVGGNILIGGSYVAEGVHEGDRWDIAKGLLQAVGASASYAQARRLVPAIVAGFGLADDAAHSRTISRVVDLYLIVMGWLFDGIIDADRASNERRRESTLTRDVSNRRQSVPVGDRLLQVR